MAIAHLRAVSRARVCVCVHACRFLQPLKAIAVNNFLSCILLFVCSLIRHLCAYPSQKYLTFFRALMYVGIQQIINC